MIGIDDDDRERGRSLIPSVGAIFVPTVAHDSDVGRLIVVATRNVPIRCHTTEYEGSIQKSQEAKDNDESTAEIGRTSCPIPSHVSLTLLYVFVDLHSLGH